MHWPLVLLLKTIKQKESKLWALEDSNNRKMKKLSTQEWIPNSAQSQLIVSCWTTSKFNESCKGKEVILCGGAINTPQILQLSGIGKADDLKDAGVRCILNTEGVGYHLQGKVSLVNFTLTETGSSGIVFGHYTVFQIICSLITLRVASSEYQQITWFGKLVLKCWNG